MPGACGATQMHTISLSQAPCISQVLSVWRLGLLYSRVLTVDSQGCVSMREPHGTDRNHVAADWLQVPGGDLCVRILIEVGLEALSKVMHILKQVRTR